jgi:hypothetical protein
MNSAPSSSQHNYDLQLRKLTAETEKTESERDKVIYELQEARTLSTKVFARLSSLFTPMVAIITIVLSYQVGLYKTESTKAQLEVAKAQLESAKAQLEKEEAINEKTTVDDRKRTAEAALENLKQQLANVRSNADKERERAKDTFATDAQILRDRKTQIDEGEKALTELREHYQTLATVGYLQQLIDLLNREPSDKQTVDSRFIGEICHHVTEKEQYKSARIDYLTSAANNATNPAGLRALLYYSLFIVTPDQRWLDRIEALASQSILASWPTFSSLMTLEQFDTRARTNVICRSYANRIARGGFISSQEFVDAERATELDRINLLSLDPDALMTCRAIYFDHLNYMYHFWKSTGEPSKGLFIHNASTVSSVHVRSSWAAGIISVPHQAVVTWYIQDHPGVTASKLAELGFPSSTIANVMRPSATQWTKEHQQLANAWTPYFIGQCAWQCSDNVMIKMLTDQWVTEADLQ